MSDFDYLSVLISIVLGLGIANILGGFAGIIRNRHRVVMYWPLLVTLTTLFLIHVQTWWTMFGLRNVHSWNFPGFLVVLMHPVLLFFGSVMIVPEFSTSGPIDLKVEFFRERRWFFASLMAIIVFSLMRPLILAGRLAGNGDIAAQLFFFIVCGIGWASPSELVQKIIPPAMLLAFLAYVAALFVNLG